LSILVRGLRGGSERSDVRAIVEPEERVRECFEGEGAVLELSLPNGLASEVELRGDIRTGEEARRLGEPGIIFGDDGLRVAWGAEAEKVGVTNGDTGTELYAG
jgi:hypothetical protein